MTQGIGYGSLRKIDGRPALQDITRGKAPDWRGRSLEIGFGADFSTEIPAGYFTHGRADTDYVRGICYQAVTKLIPDAMQQIHGRLRGERLEVDSPPDAAILAAYTTTENHAALEVPPPFDPEAMRPVFHRMMGTLELLSPEERRWDEIMVAGANKIAGLIALNAQAALREHNGGEGRGPEVPTALELRVLDGYPIMVDRTTNTFYRLPKND